MCISVIKMTIACSVNFTQWTVAIYLCTGNHDMMIIYWQVIIAIS